MPRARSELWNLVNVDHYHNVWQCVYCQNEYVMDKNSVGRIRRHLAHYPEPGFRMCPAVPDHVRNELRHAFGIAPPQPQQPLLLPQAPPPPPAQPAQLLPPIPWHQQLQPPLWHPQPQPPLPQLPQPPPQPPLPQLAQPQPQLHPQLPQPQPQLHPQLPQPQPQLQPPLPQLPQPQLQLQPPLPQLPQPQPAIEALEELAMVESFFTTESLLAGSSSGGNSKARLLFLQSGLEGARAACEEKLMNLRMKLDMISTGQSIVQRAIDNGAEVSPETLGQLENLIEDI